MPLSRSVPDWSLVPLGDVARFVGSGATPRGGKNSYHDSGTTLIRSMNVFDLEFKIENLVFLSEEQAAKLKAATVEPADVLLNITGASVARCCMVPDQVLPARVNQHVLIIRTNHERCDPAWLSYTLASPYYKALLMNLASRGATREALTKEGILAFKVALPSIEVQRKNAAVLTTIDSLIKNNRRRIELLEETARLLYREWFVNFRYPGHEDVPLVDSELGPIPEGWEVKALNDITEQLETGKLFDSKSVEEVGEIGVLSQAQNGYMGYHNQVPGVVASPEAPVFTFANHTCAMRLMMKPFSVIQNVFPKIGKASVAETLFAYHSGLDRQTTEEYKGHHPRWRDTLVVLPQLEIQTKFCEVVESIHGVAEILSDLIENLTAARDLLLPRLVSGELDVSDLELTG